MPVWMTCSPNSAIDEQITQGAGPQSVAALRGYLVIDLPPEPSIDVNTGKFTGSGGNLEETVTGTTSSREDIIRQLRLRDIGGIIVIDFIDMVLSLNRGPGATPIGSNVCGRDRTRIRSPRSPPSALVQMTRRRPRSGLLEAYSSSCEHCKGRG